MTLRTVRSQEECWLLDSLCLSKTVPEENADIFDKKIIVLGSSGFIGKSIVKSFSKNKTETVIGITSSDVDLRDEKQVFANLPGLMRNSVVVMAASITRDRDSSTTSLLSNIKMDTNLANVLSNYPAAFVIYISTIDVYGRECLTLPLNEKSWTKPSNYYAISKLAGEHILCSACTTKQIPFTILRIPALFGPGDTHSSPIKNFIISAINREIIKIRGTGNEMRNFLYIDDVSQVVKAIILNQIEGLYNVVNKKSFRINHVIKIIEKLCNYPLEVVSSDENRDFKEMNIEFDATNFLNSFPEFNCTEIEIGIKKTYEYYRDLQK